MMHKITGEEYHSALVDWIKNDIKESPRQHYDLGKFFFTVSIGTVGAVTALLKSSGPIKMDYYLGSSFIFLMISIIISLVMVVPREQSLKDNYDLSALHARKIAWTTEKAVAWFGVWFAGIFFGGIAVFTA
jgi:hypothetical protein